MQSPPRVPPRFVPTLTEVVLPTVALETPQTLREEDALAAGMLPGQPTPSLGAEPGTETVHQQTLQSATLAAEALEDQIIHRVMQRVDLSLERRLKEAIASMVLQQTQSLVPRLREEIEFVVRQSVSDAVADELATRSPP
ncbi:hypothetical protein [Variovorax sp. HJSM1_2]|uniref:hypothetical protein n=1 Tax=Variovorax sp. HJSM1_2 TaxID=3366263 RepID=UPI003BC68D03